MVMQTQDKVVALHLLDMAPLVGPTVTDDRSMPQLLYSGDQCADLQH